MSLINQMLRDLDARQAPAADRTGLPNAVRVRQRVKRRRSQPALALALVAVAAGVWYWQSGRIEPVAVPPAPVPPSPRVAAVSPPLATVQAAAPATLPAAAPAAPPEAKQPAVIKPAAEIPARPKPAGKPAEAKPLAPSPAPVVAAPAPEAAAEPAAIDKQSRTAPAHELAEADYRKAMAALRRGSAGEAVEGLRAALRANKLHVSARQALLSLMVEQQQLGEAQALCEEGLALDPTQAAWAMVLARLQTENGKLAEAADTLARHAAHAGQNADYQAFHALLLRKLKRNDEAAERYRLALALKPGDALWWYGLGVSLEAGQKLQEARGAFLKARELGSLPPELAAAVEQRLR